jgi:hypothetical protein
MFFMVYHKYIWFENTTLTKDEIATRTQLLMLEAARRMQTLKRKLVTRKQSFEGGGGQSCAETPVFCKHAARTDT